MIQRFLLLLLAFGCLTIGSQRLTAEESNADTQAKIAERDQLRNRAIELANEGQLDEAIKLVEQVYPLEGSIFGPAHVELLGTLNFHAQLAQAKNDDQGLIDVRQRQQRIAEQLYGKDDYRSQDAARAVADAQQRAAFTPEQKSKLNQANSLHSQMMQAYQQGEYPEAIRVGSECLTLRKQVQGENHPAYATCLNNLAGLYYSMGDFPRAEPLYREAMAIVEKVLGKEHPDYATSLNNLALLYDSMGDYPRAEPLHREAMAIREKVLGKEHPDYATSLNNLAGLYKSMGDYPRAEPLYREAIAIVGKVLGKEHPHYATSLNNLAGLYKSMGDYPRAEPLYREAMAIREKVLGKGHPSYALSLNNLAGLYYSMGNYPRAEPLYREAMAIYEKVLGKEHPDYALSLNNLAALYKSMGDYPRAEALYREAMEIREKVLGKEHPDYATSLNSLAALYESMGDYPRAEPLYREAMAIREKVLGKEHPSYATSLNHLAGLYNSMGDYPQAEPLYREAIAISEKVLGKEHPDYATSLGNLAGLYHSMGDYPWAEPLYREAVAISLNNLERTADVQSERQQVRMAESLRHRLDSYLSLATHKPKFQEPAYAALLRWKGSVWQRQRRQQALRDQPSLVPRFSALQDVSSKLSTLILNPPSDPSQRAAWQQNLEKLTDQRETLQRDLTIASVEFRQSQQIVTPDQLRQSLTQGELLVDFLEFWFFTPAEKERGTKYSRERHLLVHLVQADKEIQAIDLGPVKTLYPLVRTWRRDLGQSPAAASAAMELRKRIWQPIEAHLSGISTVYISPDGLLGQFPLAALPGKRPGSYLLEELAIIQLPVPQGLPAMKQANTASSPDEHQRFCLVGGVDYEKIRSPDQSVTPENPSVPIGSQLLAARGGQWQAFTSLPGTESEIKTIESMIGQHRPSAETTILRSGAASEAAFAQAAPGQHYLHIATHGFFAPESVQNAMTANTPERTGMLSMTETRSPRIVGQHPDLLSGLVFAGANQPPTADAEDGILTAAEVQKLDLRKVELAVLSACETGLGRTAGGEGIIGLQRAFQLAGARTTITSLWKVDDAATQALMVEFYRNLFERKLSKLESLRQAQIWLLNNPDAIEGLDLTTRGSVRRINITADTKTTADKPACSLPAYWAAFQLSGDPR